MPRLLRPLAALLALLLSACARLSAPWRLLLAGEGEQRGALEQLAGALDVAQNVQFLGRRGSGDMAAFYQGLDVFVLPSRTQPNWMEQFGRVLVEAMACGVPVIGARSGEIPHVIGDAGLIVPEEDSDALRAGLLQLMQDDELRRDLGRRGRQRVLERFTQAQIAAETVDVYRSLSAS